MSLSLVPVMRAAPSPYRPPGVSAARLLALLIMLLATVIACSRGAGPATPKPGADRAGGPKGAASTLTGAGATFPAPLYSKWAEDYREQTKIQVNYQSIGSGGGIQQITAKTVDFGASDAPMQDDELAKASGEILHIPTVFGAVAVTYNLPSEVGILKFTGETVANIFLGNITKWDDTAISETNKGVELPGDDLSVVHRSDGSGTTDIFTNYLSTVNLDWRSKVGRGKEVPWPTGLGGKGNEGVSALVKQTPNSIGYVELAYARQNGLPTASIRNREGAYVAPGLQSVTAAAANVEIPDDLRFSMVDAAGADSYPIAGATWLLVYKEQADLATGKAVVDFLWWGLHEGQELAPELLYSPLPPRVATKAEAKVRSITFQGQPILEG